MGLSERKMKRERKMKIERKMKREAVKSQYRITQLHTAPHSATQRHTAPHSATQRHTAPHIRRLPCLLLTWFVRTRLHMGLVRVAVSYALGGGRGGSREKRCSVHSSTVVKVSGYNVIEYHILSMSVHIHESRRTLNVNTTETECEHYRDDLRWRGRTLQEEGMNRRRLR
jgi:hypothetical protein